MIKAMTSVHVPTADNINQVAESEIFTADKKQSTSQLTASQTNCPKHAAGGDCSEMFRAQLDPSETAFYVGPNVVNLNI